MTRPTDLSDEELARMARRAERELPDAPAWLVRSALAMWRAPVAEPTLGQRLAAALRFDSWAPQPVPTLRSAAPAARQLLFSAEGLDIDLRVSADGTSGGAAASFAISGQVLGPGDDGSVTLERAEGAATTVALDEFGEFRFAGVAAGPCRISLSFGEVRIELPVFDVGDEPPA